MKHTLLFCATFLNAVFLNAQNPQLNSFTRIWGTPSTAEIPVAIVNSGSGGIYIAGHSGSNIPGQDGQGKEVFTKYYGGLDNEAATSMALGKDGNLFIGAYVDVLKTGDRNAVVYCLNLDGTLRWSRGLAMANEETTLDVTAKADGGCIALLFQRGASVSESILVEYNKNGSTGWMRNATNDAYATIEWASGNEIYVGGEEDFKGALQRIVPGNAFQNWLSFPIDADSLALTPVHLAVDSIDKQIAVLSYGTDKSVLSLYNTDGKLVWHKTVANFNVETPKVSFAPNGGIVLSAGSRLSVFNRDGSAKLSDFTNFSSTGISIALDHAVLPDNRIAVLGKTRENQGGEDAALLIFSDSLRLLARYTYGKIGPDHNERGWMVRQANGGYIVCGERSFPGKLRDIELTKTDAKGNIQWSNHYGTERDELGRTVQPTSDGGYIVSGYRILSTAWYVIKVDRQGIVQWEKTYNFGNMGSTTPSNLVPLSNGGYIGTASGSLTGAANTRRPLLILLDEKGDTVWTRKVGTGVSNAFRNLLPVSEGFAATGWRTDINAAWMMLFNNDGQLLWEKTEPGGIAYGVTQLFDGSLAFAGIRDVDGINGDSLFIARFETNGNELGRTYHSFNGGHLWTRLHSNDVGMSVISYFSPNDTGDNQIAFTRFLNEGQFHSRTVYYPNFDMFIYDGILLPDNSMAAVGYARKSNTEDYLLVKTERNGLVAISSPLGVKPTLQISPNPSDGRAQLLLESEATGEVVLRLFDATGKLVRETQDRKQGQRFQHSFDLPNLPPGTYFWQACAGEQCAGTQWIKN
jgi:Secretion system C-terminal sorting domain